MPTSWATPSMQETPAETGVVIDFADASSITRSGVDCLTHHNIHMGVSIEDREHWKKMMREDINAACKDAFTFPRKWQFIDIMLMIFMLKKITAWADAGPIRWWILRCGSRRVPFQDLFTKVMTMYENNSGWSFMLSPLYYRGVDKAWIAAIEQLVREAQPHTNIDWDKCFGTLPYTSPTDETVREIEDFLIRHPVYVRNLDMYKEFHYPVR